jgi:hypothetical protein
VDELADDLAEAAADVEEGFGRSGGSETRGDGLESRIPEGGFEVEEGEGADAAVGEDGPGFFALYGLANLPTLRCDQLGGKMNVKVTILKRCASTFSGAMPLYRSRMRRAGSISAGIEAANISELALAAAAISSGVFFDCEIISLILGVSTVLLRYETFAKCPGNRDDNMEDLTDLRLPAL